MKKRSFFASILMVAVMMGMASCIHVGRTIHVTDDEQVSETRSLKDFEKIEISGSPTVYYTQADSFSVVVKGAAASVENILTEVDGGTLRIRNRGKVGVVNIVISDEADATVYVCSPDLVGVTLNGSGDFISERRVDTDAIDIVLRGSGDVDFSDLICDRCKVELVGSGNIDLDRVETQKATASLVGSGDIDLHLWNAATTSLSLKGSGDIDAEFSKGCGTVECELRGSGDISLKGEVRHLTKHKSGSGDVDDSKLTVK